MAMDSFKALLARQDGDQITAAIETLEPTQLGDGDVTIRVAYSSVNYKDALALTPVAASSASIRWCRASTSPAR
jgi:NADPH:quinone reductase-like Zn-dependent oxidoreductase